MEVSHFILSPYRTNSSNPTFDLSLNKRTGSPCEFDLRSLLNCLSACILQELCLSSLKILGYILNEKKMLLESMISSMPLPLLH